MTKKGDINYESREPDRRPKAVSRMALRIPDPTEQQVLALDLADAGTLVAATAALANAGIPSEVQKIKPNDVPRKSWQPGLRRIMVWSTDEDAARQIIEALQARRERAQRAPRYKPETDSSGGGGDGGYFDISSGIGGSWD